jgi:hypothetical protein
VLHYFTESYLLRLLVQGTISTESRIMISYIHGSLQSIADVPAWHWKPYAVCYTMFNCRLLSYEAWANDPKVMNTLHLRPEIIEALCPLGNVQIVSSEATNKLDWMDHSGIWL